MSATTVKLIGIDFSGAKDAGRKIWIAEAEMRGEETRIMSLRPATDLPGSGTARSLCLPALRNLISGSGPSFVGIDFPFSLPEFLIREREWKTFASDFGTSFETPDAFRSHSTGISFALTGKKETRRQTDIDQQTPFCPYNLRMYKQTYFGIRDLLAPLVCRDLVRVVPMQKHDPALPTVVEICPASTLKANGLADTHYKKRANRAERIEII